MAVRPWNGDMEGIVQAAAIPYRMIGGRLEFCLVTATSGRWTFPKGTIKRPAGKERSSKDRTAKDPRGLSRAAKTALDEAWEEAGIEGSVQPQPFAVYDLPKSSGDRVAAFLMRVTRVAKKWPESDWRKREWAERVQAAALLNHPDLLEVLASACWEIEKARAG